MSDAQARAPHEPRLPQPPMLWDGWGDPLEQSDLPEKITALLSAALGTTDPVPRIDRDAVRLRPSRLTDEQLAALTDVVGPDHLSTADADRLLRAGGKSTPDLLARRDPGVQDAPDAVVSPGDEFEIAELLEMCARRSVAIVPFGGGTSVVGGLDPEPGAHSAVISLDMRRFDWINELDETSQIAEFGAGVTGPRAEVLLSQAGFSLGHFPQSFEYATLGGFAATRSSGQASAGHGRFDDMVTGIRMITPAGTLDLGRAPASAAGPDLRELVLGSEGVFGVITAVRVRVHPTPETVLHRAWAFDDFAAGAAALRAVAQTGTSPTVIRLSDEVETGINLATTDAIGDEQVTAGCLAVTTFEGPTAVAEAHAGLTAAALTAAGGRDLGEAPAKAWRAGRFSAPYLRDGLLSAGALVETLETATVWSNVDALKAAVTAALTESLGAPALVMCHISHIYPTGCSLYFTVVAGPDGAGDPAAQWGRAKDAATTAICDHGGTITHHHAVGADHRPWLTREVGQVGVRMLRAVKEALDPAGIMNPGALIP